MSDASVTQADLDQAEQTASDIDLILSAAPIPFEVNGHIYTLRQPTRVERDRLKLIERAASDWARSQPAIQELAGRPITPDRADIFDLRLEWLRKQMDEAEGDQASDWAEQIEALEMVRPTDLMDQRITEHSVEVRDGWMIESLLAGQDGKPLTEAERKQFILDTWPDPLASPAREASRRILRLMSFDPKVSAGSPA